VAVSGGRPKGERGRHKRKQGERRKRPLIIKATYCKRDNTDRRRAKDNVRYITHRRDREGERVTRDLFGFDGFVSKDTAYRMIDEAPKKGRYYYRVIVSPDPRREDSYRDLDLRSLTIATMLKLEERYGKSIQFVAALHDDHAPHRHVHALVILNGRRLTRSDFAALRDHARNRSLTQRRYMDRVRRLELLAQRSRSYQPPFASGGNTNAHRGSARREQTRGRFSHSAVSLCSYTCPLCGRYQALPYSRTGYRCLLDGVYLRRGEERGYSRMMGKSSGMERERAL
jgi:hypothetical protein